MRKLPLTSNLLIQNAIKIFELHLKETYILFKTKKKNFYFENTK